MSTRKRLTRRQAAADKTPYPGTVNQPSRHDPEMDEYANWEQSINHELPDMRTEWKNDQRNEIGFGIPTMAAVRSAASKAVKLAVMMLGDKVAETVIEAQARDFMRLGSKALEASLLRFAETQALYAEDMKEEEPKAEDMKEEPKAAVKAEDKKEEPKVEASKKACACQADDKKEEPKAAVKAEDMKKDDVKAEDMKKEEPKAEDKKEASAKKAEVTPEMKEVPKGLATDGTNLVSDDKKEEPKVEASSKKKAEDMKKEEPKAEDMEDDVKAMDDELEASDDEMEEPKAEDMMDEGKKASNKKADEGSMDVDLNATASDEPEMTADEEKELASIYADDLDEEMKAAEEEKEAKKASSKKGIKTLGGQPRMASAPKGEVDLSSIWNSAPDVSSVFE